MSKKKKKLVKKSGGPKKVFEVERITWKDHFSSSQKWVDPSEVRSTPMINMSVGFRIKEDKDTVTLAQNMGENLTVADCTTIIKSCIVKRLVLGAIHYDKA